MGATNITTGDNNILIGNGHSGNGTVEDLILIGTQANNTTCTIDVSTAHYIRIAGADRFSVQANMTTSYTDFTVNGNLYNSSGHALLPNSYRVSGSHTSEVRMFVLDLSMMLVDSSQAQVVHAPASSANVLPVQQSIYASSVMGGRVNSSNNEGCIYISPNLIPPG